MDYLWEKDGTLTPVIPQPSFSPVVGALVRIKSPYNQDRYYPVVRCGYPSLFYKVVAILERNAPTVLAEATEEVSYRVADPFPREERVRPRYEIPTGFLELVD